MKWIGDTSEEVAALVAGRFAAMTPAERGVMTASMFDSARTLAAAGIGIARPTRVQWLDKLYPELRNDAALRARLELRDRE